MGRNIPFADHLSILLHQTFSFSFLLVGMVAVIAISATLCGIKFRRKSPSQSNLKPLPESSPPLPISSENFDKTSLLPLKSASQHKIRIERSNSVASQQAVGLGTKFAEQNVSISEDLPLPPSKQLKETFSCKTMMTKSASTRNLVKNMSMKLPRNLSMIRRDDYQKKGGIKLKHEDSIWTKTIILGEKCRVPDDDDGEPVIYDSKGTRISTYHPRTSSSLSVSRQNSFVDFNSIPSVTVDRKEKNAKEENDGFS